MVNEINAATQNQHDAMTTTTNDNIATVTKKTRFTFSPCLTENTENIPYKLLPSIERIYFCHSTVNGNNFRSLHIIDSGVYDLCVRVTWIPNNSSALKEQQRHKKSSEILMWTFPADGLKVHH